uniref:Uncharacterized protein n=1 Tax=Tetraselmis sp. GSL018 TaxID=582737 RepID=A0A061RLG6_9CHLO
MEIWLTTLQELYLVLFPQKFKDFEASLRVCYIVVLVAHSTQVFGEVSKVRFHSTGG